MKKNPIYLTVVLILLFGTIGALHFRGAFRTAAPSAIPETSPLPSSFTAEAENNKLSVLPHLPPLLPAPAQLPPLITSDTYSTRYRIVALPKKFVANALNDETEIAGTWIKGEGRAIPGEPATYWQAAVWKNETVTRYPNAEEQVECSADAISETSKMGCVGGVTYSEPIIHGRDSAFIWNFSAYSTAKSTTRQDPIQVIGHLSEKSSVVFSGINHSDQAVGWCGPNDATEPIIYEGRFSDVAGDDLVSPTGFYWDGKQLLELGAGAAAYGINERNQVVGVQEGNIALWQENERTFLGKGRAYCINNRGWIVGETTMSGKNFLFYNSAPLRHAFLWRGSGALEDLKCLPGDTNSKARWINDKGQIVDLSLHILGEYKTQMRAVLWQAGKITDLNTLLPHGSRWVLTDARAINNKGQIIGQGLFDGNERSFLLTPR